MKLSKVILKYTVENLTTLKQRTAIFSHFTQAIISGGAFLLLCASVVEVDNYLFP